MPGFDRPIEASTGRLRLRRLVPELTDDYDTERADAGASG
jgi:hypothetical protein